MDAWSRSARATPALVPMRSSVSPTKANQFVARLRAVLLEPLVMPISCAWTPAMNAPCGRAQRVGPRLAVIMIDYTHDCDEGVDGIEEGCVAVGLSLQGSYGSLDLKLVQEIGDGSELVARRCLLQRVAGHGTG